MRSTAREHLPFALDREALLSELMSSQSCATGQEALALICEKAMGRWSAAQCREELEELLAHESVVRLGRSELLAEVFTTKATRDLEADIERRFEAGKARASHAIGAALVDRQFDGLERELRARLGVEVSLGQQREAALRVACEPGDHALLVGWAGTGKTTLLKATAAAMREGGLEVFGCCQSAAAAQNLARETGVPSRTVASLMLALRDGRARLGPKSVLILDEAGMVGSREFGALQEAALEAGAKLVCVGDPKQLQPIEAGGVFASLARIHGAAEISAIQRQRTDFEPLLEWLESREARRGGIDADKAQALRGMPEEARLDALEALCAKDATLARGFERWRARFDHEWMREAVELLAKGSAREALALMDAKGRVKVAAGREAALSELMSAWASDRTPLARKAIVAATRADVAELNARARRILIERGAVDDSKAIEVEIVHRDESRERRRFAAGDRVVFTMNDRNLGVANGAAGSIAGIESRLFGTLLVVELDDPNHRGETTVRVPASFGRLDHAYCLTNHKSQGRTYDSAHVLAGMLDREWAYVACSRARFATTLYADASSLGLVDPESHRSADLAPKPRAAAIEALASRMRRSRAKGTTLDYDDGPDIESEPLAEAADIGRGDPALASRMLSAARRFMTSLSAKRRRSTESAPSLAAAGVREQEREATP